MERFPVRHLSLPAVLSAVALPSSLYVSLLHCGDETEDRCHGPCLQEGNRQTGSCQTGNNWRQKDRKQTDRQETDRSQLVTDRKQSRATAHCAAHLCLITSCVLKPVAFFILTPGWFVCVSHLCSTFLIRLSFWSSYFSTFVISASLKVAMESMHLPAYVSALRSLPFCHCDNMNRPGVCQT